MYVSSLPMKIQIQIQLFFVPDIKIVSLEKKLFWNFMKWGLKGGISIDADSGPPRYVLWCCGGICHQPDTFIQSVSGHTVWISKVEEQ